jgi:hypothetical protein
LLSISATSETGARKKSKVVRAAPAPLTGGGLEAAA